MLACHFFVFFFSSRRRHTRSLCDWSSDVCSSDLPGEILREVIVPIDDARTGTGYKKMVQPASGFAIVGVAARVRQNEIGRASCRERVENSVVAGSLKKKGKRYRRGQHE